MYMVMFVLSDPTMLDDVLDAWEQCKVGGVTILECTGIHKRRHFRQHLPLRFSFGQCATEEEGHYTLMAVVETAELAQCCLTAAEAVVGDLDTPNTGVFAAWPLAISKGIAKPPYEE